MASMTFEDVVAGRVPCHRVWEDEHHLAILSTTPTRPGHTLVFPKRLHAYVFGMPAAEYEALWRAAREVALLLERALACPRVCLAVIGWEVRHVHVHLVPTGRGGEFPGLPGRAASQAELDAMLARLTRDA
jgi:histidine triad (HIT) family protein